LGGEGLAKGSKEGVSENFWLVEDQNSFYDHLRGFKLDHNSLIDYD
jgi:hypothetical protein